MTILEYKVVTLRLIRLETINLGLLVNLGLLIKIGNVWYVVTKGTLLETVE